MPLGHISNRRKGQGYAPLSLALIYMCGGGRAAIPTFWCSLPPLPSTSPLPWCLAKPCRIATLLHHHHAVVLLLDGVFLNLSLSPCWIKAWETSPGCTCVEAKVPCVRHLIIGDLNHDEYDSFNPFS